MQKQNTRHKVAFKSRALDIIRVVTVAAVAYWVGKRRWKLPTSNYNQITAINKRETDY